MNRKVALINDMTLNGRSAVLSQIPIISSFGDRAYVGVSENIKYDAFITGYIENASEILKMRELIADAKLDNQNVLALVDPVFADKGNLYTNITKEHVTNYKKLIEISDIMTPNLTEACVLADVSFDEYKDKYCTIKYENESKEKVDNLSKKIIETIFPLLDKLRFKKNQITIVTGIELYNSILTVLDVYDGDHGKRQTTCNYSEKVEEREGAGEIFDAMFFETCTGGFNLVDSLSVSTSFINNSLRFSRDKKIDKTDGIVYEPILNDNVNVIKQKLREDMKKVKGE